MHHSIFRLESATGAFPVPYSTGYQTYGGILSVIDEAGDSDIATDIHEDNFSGLSNSGLIGKKWGQTDRNYHHEIRPVGEATYDLHLGVSHPKDRDVFEALMRAFVIEDQNLPLAHGELSVVEVSTDRISHAELLEQSAEIAESATGVRMNFLSPTCRQRYGDVWEATPHRVSLFSHLLNKWNQSAPDDAPELSIDSETIGESIYPQVNTESYQTNTMVVYRAEPSSDTRAASEDSKTESVTTDGGRRQAQGYMGVWDFKFKDASESTRTAILSLAQFAKFTGVGRFTARGGGAVEPEILGV